MSRNINVTNNDPFDRYKMPNMQIKIENNSTNISNIVAISKSLKIPRHLFLIIFFILWE
jgi:hypothetical protein